MGIVYDRTIALAKLETTFGTDAAPTQTDAIEALDPNLNLDFNYIEREVQTGDMSPKGGVLGRKQGGLTFRLEVKANGNVAQQSKLGRLLKACWMNEYDIPADGTIFPLTGPISFGSASATDVHPVGAFTWATTTGADGVERPTVGGTYAGTHPSRILLECTTGGGSGVAEFTITSTGRHGDTNVSQTGVVMTDATAFVLGPAGSISFEPTIIRDFAVGDKFVLFVFPEGYLYTPKTGDDLTDGYSVTLVQFADQIEHKFTGCRGTWSVNCTAGEIGEFDFSFIGNYVDVAATNSTFPASPTFEPTQPPQVELGGLYLPQSDGTENTTICMSQVSMDMSNNIVPKLCLNSSDGFRGAKVSERTPTFDVDPEAVLEPSHGFWQICQNGRFYDLFWGIGSEVGNRIYFGGKAQTRDSPYADQDNTRILNISGIMARENGDDELFVYVG